MKPHVVAAVFARGGSKGVPRKNLRLLAGRPLLAHAIEVARAVPGVDRVIVSTEDAEIAEVARRWGAEVPFRRPEFLATDEAPEWLAWRHALDTLDAGSPVPVDILVSVPATSPLRRVEDVTACLRLLEEGGADVVLTVTPSRRSPYFNMVARDGEFVRLFSPLPRAAMRRQDVPPTYDITTVAYAARAAFVRAADSMLAGRVKAVVVPEERALDIDTERDLAFAEFLAAQVSSTSSGGGSG